MLELVQAHAARGAIVVLGNHDAAALGRMVPGLNSQALAAIAWTRPRLTKGQLAFLEALPTTVREDDRLFVHASAADELAIARDHYPLTFSGPDCIDRDLRVAIGPTAVRHQGLHDQQLLSAQRHVFDR